MKRLMLLSCMLFLFSPNSWAWSLFGNYDDCVLDRIESGMGGAAVGAVRASCRTKYPLKKKEVSKEDKRRNEREWAKIMLMHERNKKIEKSCTDYIKKISKDLATLEIITSSIDITKTLNGHRVADVTVRDSREKYKATCYLDKNENVIDFKATAYYGSNY